MKLPILLSVLLIFGSVMATSQFNPVYSKEEEKKKEIVIIPGKPRQTGPEITQEYIETVNIKAEGIGFGYELGYWTPTVSFGVRLSIPFGKKRNVGVQFRLFMPQGYFEEVKNFMGNPFIKEIQHYDPCVSFALEWFWRSPVFLGLFRVYVGGGFYIGYRIHTYSSDNPDTPMFDTKYRRIGFAGGGRIGVEFFVKQNSSYFIEAGGQGPSHAMRTDGGGCVQVGHMWYFGK